MGGLFEGKILTTTIDFSDKSYGKCWDWSISYIDEVLAKNEEIVLISKPFFLMHLAYCDWMFEVLREFSISVQKLHIITTL